LLNGSLHEVTIEGRAPGSIERSGDTSAMHVAISGRLVPNVVVCLREKEQDAVAHVCSGSQCHPPVSSPEELLGILGL